MAASPSPDELIAKARAVCVKFPEAGEREAALGPDFRVGRRVFAQVFSMEDPSGRTVTMLVCRADPEEREVLRAIGHPFFIPGSGRDRIGVLLDGDTDWDEVTELITESYLALAPKRLAAQVEANLRQ